MRRLPRDYPVKDILQELIKDNLLPAILFRTSRKQCEIDVIRIGRSKGHHLNKEQTTCIREAIEEIIDKYSMEREVVYKHPQFNTLITSGVGAHHAGQLLLWRLLLEELMGKGLLRLMVATGTVAAGVDFPARTVVITAHSRRDNEGYNILTPSEFQQMSGRAGRRGKDKVGFCLVAPSIFCDARIIADIIKKDVEPLRSKYYPSPPTVLNLMKYRTVDDLDYTVRRSLASFYDRKEAEALRRSAKELENGKDRSPKLEKKIRRLYRKAREIEERQITQLQRVLRGLETLGHIEGGVLTKKGLWAANLHTNVVLELAEAIDRGIFDGVGLVEVVGLVASISGTSYKTYLTSRENPLPKELYTKMSEVVDVVAQAYERPPGVDIVDVMPSAANTVLLWMESKTWEEFSGLLRLSGVAEGDAARLVTQTADNLHQVSRLHETHKELALLAEEGRNAILRPPLVEFYG